MINESNQTASNNDPNFWNEIGATGKIVIPKYRGGGVSSFNDEYLDLLKQYDVKTSTKNLKIGDVVKGVIEKITKKEIIINCDYKDNVYVENKSADLKAIQNLQEGEIIDVIITEISNKPFQIKGSITELIKMKVATQLRDTFKDELALSGIVTEKVSAGFMVDLEIENIIVNAFMPNTLAAPNRLTDEQSDELVGQKIEVCLETLQQERGLYVVSRKKYLKNYVFEKELLKIKRGDLCRGYVTGTTPFGVFVQFNECLTGMIHKANINTEWQDKIMSIKPGTGIEFYIKDIVKKGKQIILTQIMRESVWDKVKIGQDYDGTVTGIKSFGVLVSLDAETFGLIQTPYLQKYSGTLKEGDNIKVRVISIIREDRKMYLDIVS